MFFESFANKASPVRVGDHLFKSSLLTDGRTATLGIEDDEESDDTQDVT